MQTIPRDPALDSSLAFKAEGYRFVANRCERFASDIFETRLLGKRFYCVRGEDAAKMFYTPDRFTRVGALPRSTLVLLQDEGSVATLDAEAHRRRKGMMMSLMTPPRLEAIAAASGDGLRTAARGWVGRTVTLHEEVRALLCRVVCDWAGVPADEKRLARLTGEIGAMIDNAGTIGPPNWTARVLRRGAERYLRNLVEDVRAGRLTPPAQSALAVIAAHRDGVAGNGGDGALLPADIAAVELLNILRPTVAIARFVVFAALALHQHPETRERVASDDAYLEAFVQEVRRIIPFFPVVAGVARTAFTWREHAFHEGDRFILDLYGTDHDGRIWEDPEAFRPERFLGWTGNAYTMVPQGGGAHHENHRCAGEWLTIAVMKTMVRALARDIVWEVPEQDLSVDLAKLPTLPASGFLVAIQAVR